jgi:hypothetical protein
MMQSRFGLDDVKVPFSAPWLNNPMSDVWLFAIPKKQNNSNPMTAWHFPPSFLS